MTRDGQPDGDLYSRHLGEPLTVELPPDIGRARSERRWRIPIHRAVDFSDLLDDATGRGAEVHYHRCCEPNAAPPSVVTCARRILEIALAALRPPVSGRIDIHVCHFIGQLGLQVTALDRHSFGRLVARDEGEQAVAELVSWFRAFSPVFSLEPLRRDRANIAAIIAFDPRASWARPQHLRFGKRNATA
jgi:hypothetical protein